MSKQKFGMSTKFNDVAAFLFWVNDQLRETLPGRDPNEDMDKKTMGTIRNKIWKRLESKIIATDSDSLKILVIKPAVINSQKENDVLKAARRFEELNAAATKMKEDREKEAERLKNELEETQAKLEATEAKLEEAEGKLAESEATADIKADADKKDEL